PTLRRWALASLAFAPLFLAGHPTTQVIVGFVAGLFVATRLVCAAVIGKAGWIEAARRALACLGAAVTGVMVAAAALLPFYLNLR
ncbi:MAG: hypothetical protein GTO31_11455, partial [Xanthomonadales bacterium]|nr:hypothetical protein [Xanthomonadales bacterium]